MDKYHLIKNNLWQEAKHRKQLGEAIWLYGYLLSYANMRGGKTDFYLSTYCKRLDQDKELIKSQLQLLDKTEYIIVKNVGENKYDVQINKPIKTNCIN